VRPVHRFSSHRLAASLLALLALAGCDQSRAIRQQALRDSHPVTFTSSDGVRLAGRLFGPEHPRTGIVLAHMLPSDQRSWYDFADRLGGMGYAALTFDFRGTCPGGDGGCSEGTRNVAAVWQDVEGAVTYLRSRGLGSIALVGASMGGTASLVVAAKEGSGIEAVVALSAPPSISGLSAGPDVLANVTAAKLFIAGDADGVAAEAAQASYDQSPQPKDVQIVTSSDHGTDLLEGNQAEIVRNLILTYLQQHAPA
jgi:alpha-beta hydrolase superfamily lysophospholipase